MDIIRTKEEAENWFLSHSDGSVMVENPKGMQMLCSTYPDAIKHLNS